MTDAATRLWFIKIDAIKAAFIAAGNAPYKPGKSMSQRAAREEKYWRTLTDEQRAAFLVEAEANYVECT